MSHNSRHKMKLKNLDALKSVLEEKGISFRENCVVKMYGSNSAKAALAFKLKGWKYEVAVSENGEITYDHFGSRPNTMHLLGETVQAYNKEAITLKAWEWGLTTNVQEEKVKDGIKLILEF